jgi:hypothetical protein
MKNMTHGMKTLGSMAMAALGIVVLMAGTSTAQTLLHEQHLAGIPAHQEALVKGVELPLTSSLGFFLINLGAVLLATITGAQVGEKQFLIAGRGIEIKCQTGHVEEGKINTTQDASMKLTFLGCKTYEHNNGNVIENCIFKGGTKANGATISVNALILPVLHGKAAFLLFEPQNELFATVSYEFGLGCVLPLNNPISGAFSASIDEGVVATLLFTEAVQLLTGDVIRLGVFPAYVIAQAKAELTGAHSGQKLGAH